MEATAPVLRSAPGFRFRTYPALPVDAVFLVGLVMPAIVVNVQVEAGCAQRRMPEIVAHEPQIHLLVSYVRTGCMQQPVGRSLLEQVGA